MEDKEKHTPIKTIKLKTMDKIKIALAAVALMVAGSVAAQDINAKYAQAAEAISARNFAAAVPLFEQVIAEGVDVEGAEAIVDGAKKALPTAVFQMGGAAFQGGRHDEALGLFAKAAEVAELYGNPTVLNNARTWISRTVMAQGASAFNSKDFAAAAAIFQKGYDANPNDTALAMNLAMSYSGLKEFDKSAPIYKNIIALGGTDSRFEADAARARENWSLDALEQASAAARAGDHQAAIAAADALLEVIPDAADVSRTRLEAYTSLKAYPKVIELGEATAAAQTTDETRSRVWFLVGAAYQNQQSFPQAMEAYRKVTAGDNAAAARTQIAEIQKAL
jgi:tetratricopeptide (TPR) repeat protein